MPNYSDQRPLYAPFFSVMGATSAMVFRYVDFSHNFMCRLDFFKSGILKFSF